MATSYSALSVKDQVQLMYVAYFGRAGDPAGMDHWMRDINLYHFTIEQVGDSFALSDEAKGLYSYLKYPNLNSSDPNAPTAFVTAIYKNLFERDPDTGGLNYWVDRLTGTNTKGTNPNLEHISAGTMIASIINGAYASTGPNHAHDVASMENKITVADYFTDQLIANNITWDSATMRDDAAACIADVTWDSATIATGKNTANTSVNAFVATNVQTFTLTVNQDTATASTFEGPIYTSVQTGNQIQTLTSVDKLTGTSGSSDTLNATLNATEVSTKPTLSGIEKVNLTAIGWPPSVFDAANSTGIAEIANVDSSASLTMRNLNAGAKVVVKNTEAGVDTQVQFVNSATSGADDAVSIQVNGVGRGATAGNTQILNVRGETAGSFETLNIESTGGASRFAAIGSDSTAAIGGALTATGSQVKTINVTGDANLRVDGTLFNVTTVNAAADFKGDLRVVLDNKDVTVTGGSGNDYFDFGATLSNADKVNGGDGRDTIAVTADTGLGDGNQVSNVEILRNDGAGGGTIFDLSKVSSFDAVVHATGNAATYNNLPKAGAGDAAKGVTQLDQGDITVNVKDANALGSNSDVLYINVGDGKQTAAYEAGDVTTAAIEKVVIDVKDAGAKTATADGGFLTADADLGTVEFKGGSLGVPFNAGAIAGTGAALTNIDASSFIGDLTVAGNADSQIIKGGSGNDTLSTGGRAAFSDAVASDALIGGGGADTFVFVNSDTSIEGADLTTAAASTADGLSEITTIADLNLGGSSAGTGVDKIDLSGIAVLGADPDNITIVNGGAVTPMSGTNLGNAVNTLVNAGTLLDGNATTTIGGLFSFGNEVFFIATSGTITTDDFGAALNSDIIIRVTGVTGTLDASDIIV